MDNCWTTWQIITHYLWRFLTLGIEPGRCGACGSWMYIDMVVPGVSGAVCPNCH